MSTDSQLSVKCCEHEQEAPKTEGGLRLIEVLNSRLLQSWGLQGWAGGGNDSQYHRI